MEVMWVMGEMERDKIRAAKKAAKEKRRQEALEREEVAKREEELAAMNAMRHEMEQNPLGSSAKINGNLDNSQAKTKKTGCLWTLWILLVTVFFLSIGFGASLIWIYTGGHLDQKSIERALPIIQRDVDVKMAELSLKASQLMEQTRPYTKKLQENSEWLWEDFKRRNDIVAHKINLHLGPYFCASKAAFFQYWKLAQTQAGRAWASAKPFWNQFLAVMASYVKLLGLGLKQIYPSMWIFSITKASKWLMSSNLLSITSSNEEILLCFVVSYTCQIANSKHVWQHLQI